MRVHLQQEALTKESEALTAEDALVEHAARLLTSKVAIHVHFFFPPRSIALCTHTHP